MRATTGETKALPFPSADGCGAWGTSGFGSSAGAGPSTAAASASSAAGCVAGSGGAGAALAAALAAEAREHRPDRHCLALLDEDLAHDPRRR
jgi:hypothetical protein